MSDSINFGKKAAYVIAYLSILLIAGASFAQKTQSILAGPTRPNLGTAATYVIFTGGGAINNTGASQLNGDVGQDGAYAFNGFPPGTYTGTLNRNNGASALAKADLMSAQTAVAAMPCGFVLGVGIVDGQSFDPAIYCSGAATTTSGNITFDAHGDATAIFIVKIGGQLDANSGTHILLANNAQANNIYWFVDGAVNVADNSTFKGTIVANGAISFLGTSSLDGRALAAPAGAITLSANNMGVPGAADTSNIVVVKPAQGDTIRATTTNYQITWTGTGIAAQKIFQYSLDSGVTWKTIDTISSSTFTHGWNVPDTFSTKAKVRIIDSKFVVGTSGLFTIRSNRIVVTHPLAGESIKRATQNYQITWTGPGLTPKKTFEYSLDSGATWITIGSISTNLFTYSWNLPDTVSTRAMVRITDSVGMTGKSGVFTIKSDKIVITHPLAGESVKRGTSNYQITWTGVGLTPKKTLEYSLDSGLTWHTIAVVSSNQSSYSWQVPDTVSARALIRITDSLGVTGTSGIFTIKSNTITVIRPAAGENVLGALQNYEIMWTGTGLTSRKTIDLSLDGGQTWTRVATLTADVFSYFWDVPDTASTQAVIRVTDADSVSGQSGVFTITSSKFIVVVHPMAGEIVAAGTPYYQIVWTGIGLTLQKTLDISLDGGLTWSPIGTIKADVYNYTWFVPNTPSTQAIIRITDANGTTGMSGMFTIKTNAGSIIIVDPAAGERVDGGMANYAINFTATNVTSQKLLDYSLDGGAHWTLIGLMNSDAQTFNWASVPNVATTRALVRIKDANGVIGVSGLFTITTVPSVGSINSVTLSGLDSKNNVGNNKLLGISWTYTPVIGTSVLVEYSLDYMATWHPIATVAVTESPDATAWMTTPTGYYNPVFIRVTSSLGMSRIASAFSIGSDPAGVSATSTDGYSVSNYPNPASNETTFKLELANASDVTVTLHDILGREVGSIARQHLDAGSHTMAFNTSRLAAGTYTYTVQAGATRLAGKLSIAK